MRDATGVRKHIQALVWCAAVIWALPVLAHDYTVGDIRVVHPWSNATPPGAPGAGYMTLYNGGPEPDRLVSVSADFAQVSAHKTSIEDGVASMAPVSDGVIIPAGKTVSFQPGGLHLMFTNLSSPLKAEEEHRVTLVFETAGSVTIAFKVMEHGGVKHNAH